MIFDHCEVYNLENAIRGMRNSYDSWEKSDSFEEQGDFIIGKADMELCHKLLRGNGAHHKFMRQILVGVDIVAPLFWWKEFDTYKVGTVANSTSSMHTLVTNPITTECFEGSPDTGITVKGDDAGGGKTMLSYYWMKHIRVLESLRQQYNETKDKNIWKELIRLLPDSYLQRRTITMNYEVLLNMVEQRRAHKLVEWRDFCTWCRTLPYANELIFWRSENRA